MFLIYISLWSDSACIKCPNSILVLCLYTLDGNGDLCQSVKRLVFCDFRTTKNEYFLLGRKPEF